MAFSYLVSSVRHISRNIFQSLYLTTTKSLPNDIYYPKIDKVITRLASTEAVLQNPSSDNVDFNNGKNFKIYKPITPQAWITSLDGEPKGIAELDRRVFTANPRLDILHRYVVWQLAKRRAGTAKTKNRGEVRGGGRKPWPQKHTGRARQGSIRAPHFRGGGVVHGPRPRSYDFTLPRKVRSMALRVALSVKFTQGDLHIVDSLCLEDHKTQRLRDVLDKRGWYSVLLVDGNTIMDRNLQLASKNIPNCDALPSMALNVHMMLKRHTLVLSLHAVKLLQERLVKNLAEPCWDKYDFKMTPLDSTAEASYYSRELEDLGELSES